MRSADTNGSVPVVDETEDEVLMSPHVIKNNDPPKATAPLRVS
jgi:hypothetical protein